MKFIQQLTNYIANRPKLHFWLFFGILLVLSGLMLYSYKLHPGQDFFFHLRRFQALIDSFNDGAFPSYIDYGAVAGYGYLSNIFYCDVLLIPFAIIGLFTDTITAYKAMIFGMTVLTGVLTYFSVKGIYRNSFAAAISALLYTFSYYHLYDIYRRAALGEAWAMTFVPIVFWGLYVIIKGDYKKWYILALGYTFIIFSHVLTSVMITVMAGVILFIYYKSFIKEPKRILAIVLAALATLILTAYYLYPMIEQTLSDTFKIQVNGTMNAQDFSMETYRIMWGMFLGVVYPLQTLIPGIGILLMWGVTLRLFVKEKSPQMRSIDIGIIISLVLILACTQFFPWSIPPFKWLNFIQFPWRLNIFICYFFAVAGGYCFYKLLVASRRYIVGLASVAAFVCIILVSDGQCFQYENNRRSMNEPANRHTFYHIIGGEYLPAKIVSPEWLEDRGNVVTMGDSVISTHVHKKSSITIFTINNLIGDEATLELPLVYYKGYDATINGQRCKISESDNGLVELHTAQQGTVIVQYAGTFVQKIGLFITIIAFISLCIYIFVVNKRRKVNETN